ncbi:MAG TPA: WhiB family transcriptional regulator [Propionibacteriaceae bacterium]
MLHHLGGHLHQLGSKVPRKHHLWLSEHIKERALAVRLCRGCPVLRECREAATAHRERFGVWGGKVFSPRPYEIKINKNNHDQIGGTLTREYARVQVRTGGLLRQ